MLRRKEEGLVEVRGGVLRGEEAISREAIKEALQREESFQKYAFHSVHAHV